MGEFICSTNFAILLCVSAAVLSYFVTTNLIPYVISISDRLGFVDIPDPRRIHASPVCRAGGIAVFLSILLTLLIVSLSAQAGGAIKINFFELVGVFAAAAIIFLTGLLDDLIGLRAFGKITGQTICALVAFSCGIRIHLFLGYELPIFADLALTVLIFLTIINAFNLIDGIDGLASGLALSAVIGQAALISGGFYVILALAIAGSCCGFLRYNRNPAKLFLGDCGSNLLGFFVATLTILSASLAKDSSSSLLPFLFVSVPVLDLVVAVWRRGGRRILAWIEGKPEASRVLSGDLNHFHHKLLALSLSQRDVAAGLCLVSVTIGLCALWAALGGAVGWLLLSTLLLGFASLGWSFLLREERYLTAQIVRYAFPAARTRSAKLKQEAEI